jgi:hypothetical protein
MALQPLGTTNPNIPTYASLAKLGLTGSEASKALSSYNTQAAAQSMLPSFAAPTSASLASLGLTGGEANKAMSSYANQVANGGIQTTQNTFGNPEKSASYLAYKAGANAPVNTSAGDSTPTDATSEASFTPTQNAWNLENDPLYQSAMNAGQSAFNTARNKANFELQNATVAQQAALRAQNQQAELDRRNLSGNFAARGMQGGAHGAYAMAQDRANAALITAQTSSKHQLAALNQQYIANYGAEGTDWTATAEGQNYKNQAIQQALTALTNKYTAV